MMAEKTDVKAEALPDLDDLLQCPVCYEIPSGQIFQCNEGHHVCGRCKARLSQCPVCRALFFGTRNYAMEELISNVRKLRAFKLGGKVTTGSSGSGSNTPAEESASRDADNNAEDDADNNLTDPNVPVLRAPQACKGLFRCLCCKNGNSVRLPAARLLNHLRYFHSPELIEGQSENGEYVQAWQFSTVPGRIVTAVRVSDMGIFFLIIEITNNSVHAWLSMAAAPWVTNEFSYTVTISGNDREAIFSDCVWSVRSCEGFLKKRGRCLVVTGFNARALVAPASISGKLSVQRVRPDDAHQLAHPRAVLRVASRGQRDVARNIEPLLQDLENEVAQLSRNFASLDRDILRPRLDNPPPAVAPPPPAPAAPVAPAPADPPAERALSRNARRRMRMRLRAALNETQDAPENAATPSRPAAQRPNGHLQNNNAHFTGLAVAVPAPAPAQRSSAPTAASRTHAPSGPSSAPPRHNSANPVRIQTGLAIVQPLSSAPTIRPNIEPSAASQRSESNGPVHIPSGLGVLVSGAAPPRGAAARGPDTRDPGAGASSASQSQSAPRTNKKKRRHRR